MRRAHDIIDDIVSSRRARDASRPMPQFHMIYWPPDDARLPAIFAFRHSRHELDDTPPVFGAFESWQQPSGLDSSIL